MLFYAYHNENAGSLQSCLLNTTNIITISGLAIHCDDELLTSENAHRWGKHHCTAGLQFYKFALDCFTKYKKISFIGQFQSCLTGDQPYSDPSPNGECPLYTLLRLPTNGWDRCRRCWCCSAWSRCLLYRSLCPCWKCRRSSFRCDPAAEI